MLLYQRFEIPDDCNWSTGQPVQATDCWSGQPVLVYRSVLLPETRELQIAEAQRIHSEVCRASQWSRNVPEIFTQGGFLWAIAQQKRGEDPLIARFRQAKLLPFLPEVESPPPAPSPRCPRCKGQSEKDGVLCPACAEALRLRPRGNLLAWLGVLVVAAILVVGVVWAARFIASSLNSKATLDAKFWTNESLVAAGSSALLRWNVSGASNVTIDHGVGHVESEGVTSVSPEFSTTYTLTAIGGGQKIQRQLTIDVSRSTDKPAPGKPSPDQQPPGQESTDQDSPSQTSPTPQAPNSTIDNTPQSVSSPPSGPQPTPPAAVLSGNLRCPQPVPPHGQVIFPNLPKGLLHFDIPNRRDWMLLIRSQPDGGQTLVMVSLSAETQEACDVRWTLTP